MIYDPEASLAFVHIPKTGGWSVKAYLAEHLPDLHVPGTPDYAGWDAVHEPDLPVGHLALRDWEEQTGDDPMGFDTIIAVRRHPYEVMASQYRYWRKLWGEGHRMVQHILAVHHPTFADWLADPRASEYHVAHDYHGKRPPPPTDEKYADYGGYYRYWLALDSAMPENLEIIGLGDIDTALPDLVAPYTDEPGPVPHVNEGGHGDGWREIVGEQEAEMIRAKFAFSFEAGWFDERPLTPHSAKGIRVD